MTLTTNRPPTALLAALIITAVLHVMSAAADSTGPLILAHPPTRSRHAHLARTLNVADTAHLHLIRESESGALIEEGPAKGALPGTVNIQITLAATIHATFTIHTRYGSISGRGSGELHGTGVQASFGGSMTVTRGTGRYAHAHGHGGFYGTIDRENTHDPAIVQTTGSLSY